MPTQFGPRVDHKEEHHCPAVTQYAKSGDVSIAYQVVGEGLPDLVLVSGFLSHVEVRSSSGRGWDLDDAASCSPNSQTSMAGGSTLSS